MPIKFPIVVLFFFLVWAEGVLAQKNVDSLLNQARKMIYEDPDTAIEMALNIYEDSEVTLKDKVNSLLTISSAYTSKRDNENSLKYVLEIEGLLPSIENATQKMNILNKLGGQYQELKIYDKAIKYLDESLLLIQNYPYQDSVQTYLGHNYILRGFNYREQMSCDIALKYFDKAIEAYKKTLQNQLMNANISICYYNRGNCLLSMDRIEEAELSQFKSIEYAKKIEANSLIAFAQKGLAEVKTKEGNYLESITILQSALEISVNVGDLVLNREIYNGLSNNYLALKEWDQYGVFRAKYLDLQRETKISERKTINQSLLKLTEDKANEIKEIYERNRPIEISLICLLILFILLLVRDEVI